MKSFKEIWNGLFGNLDGDSKSKRTLQNLVIVFVIGMIMLIISGFFDKRQPPKEQKVQPKQGTLVEAGSTEEYDINLENKIKGILSQIKGVGRVSIAITYASSKEIVPAEDVKQNQSNTNEKDTEGGVRSTIQTDTDSKVLVNQESSAKPVILKEIPPQIRGVIVVAQGAYNENIKIDIARAVSTALGISLSKIQVYPMTN